jgi:ribosomal protein S18 acetylase RimI-like enzyme
VTLALREGRDADVPFLASVLEMAGRGHLARGAWDLTFPEAHERALALARIAGGEVPSWCHRRVFRVAELDGRPGAALVAFDAGLVDQATLGPALWAVFESLGWQPERMAEVGPRLAPFTRCFPDMPAGTWIVENVGTHPACRRRGLVRALLEEALASGRRSGCRTAQISCLIGNEPAQRAYEGVGFRVVEERRDAEFEGLLGAPGYSRMTLAL